MTMQNRKTMVGTAAVMALGMSAGWPSCARCEVEANEKREPYEPPPKELTNADRAALKRAEEKRERRAAKRRAMASPGSNGK